MAELPTRSLGPFTRRPAVVVALLFALGILLHDQLPLHPLGYLIAIAGLALLAAIAIRRQIICSIFISAIVVLLGISITQREHFLFATNDIGFFATDEPHLTELEGRLIDDPQIAAGPSIGRPLPPKQIVTIEVQQIKTWHGWVSATGQLPTQIDQIQPSLAAGQTVQLLGMLQRPRSAMNPGEFDWAAYYRQQRILAMFTVNRNGNVHILADPGPSWINWLRAKSRNALAAGFKTKHANDWALLEALLLGDRDPQLRDIQDEFKNTGTGYQLSVSGLHIAIVAVAIFWLCRFSRMSPRVTLAFTTGFVLLYATIALPSHSGIRSAILCIVVAAAVCAGRSQDRAQLLSLACIAMLIWHPMDLYSAGFHLSFAVVIVFVLLLPPLQLWTASWGDPDNIARPKNLQPTFMQKLRATIATKILRGLQFGVLAWMATLPLAAYHFGQASAWSILGSLALMPSVIVSLFAAALKLIFTLLWPRCAGIWATIAGWPVESVEWGVHQLAKLPGSSIALPTPPIWLIVIYYLLLLAPLLPYRRPWVLRLAPLIGVASILCLSLFPKATTRSDELKITLLSLGAGQCAVIEPPGALPIIFDAGSNTVTDVAHKIIEPFLHAEGESKIDEIFLSHGDFDHISAAGELASTFDVRQVFTSYHFRRNAAGNIPDEMLLDELEKLNRTPREIAVGDHFDLGNGAAVDVLWPPKGGDLNSNNAGLVLRLTYAGRSILFPADIQDPAFTGVLKNAKALKSDVLIAAHHGSSEDLTPAFLAAVHPDVILSSNFGRLTNKQKQFNTMAGKTPLYRTSEYGAITITVSHDGKITVTTFAKNPALHL